MVASGVMTLAQLTVEAKDGIVFLGSGNPCFPLQGQWRCSPVMIFGIVNNVGFWSVPIQAMFRYIIIVKKRQISPWFPLIVYATVGLFISSVTFPAAFLATTNSPTLPKLQSMEFWKTEDIHELCTIDILSWPVFTYLAGMVILEGTGIVLLLWFTNRLNKTLYNAQMHFSSKTKQAHKEMTRKLYAQAAIPSVMSVFLVAICACLFFMPNYYGGLFVLLLLPYPWIVVLNPLVTLCCIKQYRSVAIATLQGRCMEIKSNMSINPDSKAITTVMNSRRSVVSATFTK
uniref:G_PROTEIN_RECEP_F1_2 domain-containing protein n=1 Tax=Panagrellus redivivus TaxID=6233 RepID=A0A7E4V9E0_PANRE